jgi:hypothetical protein
MLINIATCFDHNFDHDQALNEHSQVIKHIGYNTDPYLLTDFCVANIVIMGIYLQSYYMIKKIQRILTNLQI